MLAVQKIDTDEEVSAGGFLFSGGRLGADPAVTATVDGGAPRIYML